VAPQIFGKGQKGVGGKRSIQTGGFKLGARKWECRGKRGKGGGPSDLSSQTECEAIRTTGDGREKEDTGTERKGGLP